MRLDAFISQNSDFSRSDIQRLIKLKRVTINGSPAAKGQTHIMPTDHICVDEQPIVSATARYFLLHKPSGYVCANTDAEHPTVLDLLNEPRKHLLQIAGRLDVDTTGLVLITDDGQWNHAITSPKKHCQKQYIVNTADPIAHTLIATFADGILLRGESKPTLPATLEITGTHSAKLWISEGKYHQVKRMFAACGNRVIGLHRAAIGPITLEDSLVAGNYRSLTNDEIHFLDN